MISAGLDRGSGAIGTSLRQSLSLNAKLFNWILLTFEVEYRVMIEKYK